jgi:biotin-dependent carboxylase-like uncharacterized protein
MIKVLHPGFYSTVQDLGRKEYQHLGVPFSGVMDQEASRIANAILGNDEECAVLEITMLGPKLEFDCQTVISITGADLQPKLNGEEIRSYTSVNIKTGDILSFGRLSNGFRAYMAVSGGFQTEKILGSRSMYKGLTEEFQLKKGDVLNLIPNNQLSKKYATIKFKNSQNYENISVYKGPEFEHLNAEQINQLFEQKFTISKENNRMAYQLNELIGNSLTEIITSLVMPGTIQLTSLGKLIILMRDCQTTGGYPRILQLSEHSINVLAQKKVGDTIKFKLIDYPL